MRTSSEELGVRSWRNELGPRRTLVDDRPSVKSTRQARRRRSREAYKLERKAAAGGRADEVVVMTLHTLHLDGDVVLHAPDNRYAYLSHDHETATFKSPPVGYAELSARADEVLAAPRWFEGEERACEDARDSGWSVGLRVLEAHEPTSAEQKEWPGVERMIDRLIVFEVSSLSPSKTPASPGTRSGVVCCSGRCTGSKCADCGARDEERKTLRRLVDDAQRREALGEPLGALAMHCAEWAAQQLRSTRGAPRVKFFDPDGVALGRFKHGDPGAIYIRRGLPLPDLVATVIHETSHHSDHPNSSEFLAAHAAQLFAPRYLSQFGGD